jgi:hypothetical protein
LNYVVAGIIAEHSSSGRPFLSKWCLGQSMISKPCSKQKNMYLVELQHYSTSHT